MPRLPPTAFREDVAALEAAGETLALTTMRFAHEVRSVKDLDLPRVRAGWTE